MRKILASLAATAILVGGGIAMIGLSADEASAQETESATEADRSGPFRVAIDQLVADGVITQEQADAVVEALQSTAQDVRQHRHRVRGGIGRAAEVIGIEAADLASQVQDGATIAEVAEANGVDPQDVIDAMVDQAGQRLAEAVEAGRLDQAEADERLAEIEQRITDVVNGDAEIRFGPRFGRGGGFGAPGGSNSDASFDA